MHQAGKSMDLTNWYVKNIQIAGWWFEPTPLKNDGAKVSWDDFPFPTEWKNKSHVPNHQPANSNGKSSDKKVGIMK